MTPDVIVIGLGAVGSATCHYLARAGAKVLGIDRFVPPHDQGSSHGLTRVTRLAVGEGEDYVPLAMRSHELWRELETLSNECLYQATGCLLIASERADAQAFHGGEGFFARTVRIAQQFGIAHERLTAGEIRRRYPAFAGVRDDEHGYLEEPAGVLFAERIVAAHLEQARAHGAELRLGERVLSVAQHGAGVEVTTERDRFGASKALLAVGAWTEALHGVPPGLLKVQRQVLHWFRPSHPTLYAPEICPVFIWLHGAAADGSMYGFPMVDGIAGVKVATEQYDVETNPDHVDRRVTNAEHRSMFDRHIAGRLYGVTATIERAETCLYTTAPGARFIIRRHPQAPSGYVVSACSGHGFKHSAALGEALAAKLLGQSPQSSLSTWEESTG